MAERRTWSIPVWTYVNAAVYFTTDIDPIEDPQGFREAFEREFDDFPTANATNDFELGDEWNTADDEAGNINVIPKTE
jgi:hypothetical protein